MSDKVIKIGIAGMGAIGSAVARALIEGIEGYALTHASDLSPPPLESLLPPPSHSSTTMPPQFNYVKFNDLAKACDLIIEALPPTAVPALTDEVFSHGKDLILISSCALLMFPEILTHPRRKNSRIIVPSGALIGLDGVSSLAQMGIKSARIASTKPPRGLAGAPHITAQNINLESITQKTMLFSGNALEAAKAFPANVNVAATLSLAGIGPENTQVEVWADPEAVGNSHKIEVIGEFSRMTARVENTPDPANPKSSMLAAQSIISILKKMSAPLVVL